MILIYLVQSMKDSLAITDLEDFGHPGYGKNIG
jgi:hypothetical protein